MKRPQKQNAGHSKTFCGNNTVLHYVVQIRKQTNYGWHRGYYGVVLKWVTASSGAVLALSFGFFKNTHFKQFRLPFGTKSNTGRNILARVHLVPN